MESRGSGEEQQKKLVEAFVGITSASREEALFFLESHGWQIDAAVHAFFDEDPVDSPLLHETSPPSPPHLAVTPHQPPTGKPMSSSSSSRGKKPARPARGIHTLSDLNRRSAPGSDSDSDGPPEYYTGGEKSGMLVQDPTKGGDSSNNVDAIFDQARQLGAMEGPVDPIRPNTGSRSFTGTGRLLSGETVTPPAPLRQEPDVVIHNIIFWRNGFSVDDGPLRRLDDPENASFLESITKSECPKELEPADKGTAVHVNLTRRDENYPEPEKRHVPFQGIGRTLGGGSSPIPQSASGAAATNPVTAPTPSAGLIVDDSKPSTSIQLRLGDGTRMVARFNFHHTVGDIRAFIDASRPGGSQGYQLQTVGFPPKQLNDASQTIEQAGLANSVVIQKL